MIDLRDYKNVIKEAVALETEKDKNWKWKVVAVNKKEIKIGWGYLDYCGEKSPFRIRLEEYTDDWMDPMLVGYNPGVHELNPYEYNEDFVCIIGNKHWHDARTIEEGLKMIIHNIAWNAHNTF